MKRWLMILLFAAGGRRAYRILLIGNDNHASDKIARDI